MPLPIARAGLAGAAWRGTSLAPLARRRSWRTIPPREAATIGMGFWLTFDVPARATAFRPAEFAAGAPARLLSDVRCRGASAGCRRRYPGLQRDQV
jgi:hypothetical protein